LVNFKRAAERLGLPVYIGNYRHARTDGRAIFIPSTLTQDDDRLRALIHEAAHIVLGALYTSRPSRAIRELEAEAAAAAVCKALGIPVGDSKLYIKAWIKAVPASVRRANVERAAFAGSIILRIIGGRDEIQEAAD